MVNYRKLNKYEIGKILMPEKIYKFNFKDEMESLYMKLHFDNFNYYVITNLFTLSVIFTLVAYVFAYPPLSNYFATYFQAGGIYRLLSIFISWFIMNLVIYFAFLFSYFFYKESKFRKNEFEIEKSLPEFIDNLVSNLKGGISLEKAMLQSVRKEQKALLQEITLINEKLIMGKETKQALKEFRLRFDSPIINRTFFLIEEGLKGGGDIAAPLERISDNLKRIYNLDEEIKSNSSGFAVVISSITILIAPLLFALAITLLSFITNLFELMSESNEALSIMVYIPPEFGEYLTIFSYAMISVITFFSSLIVAQLKNEKIYKVIKYLPLYIIIALVLYNTFSRVFLGFFGNLL